jgi:enoyl-CoA hydratase
MSQQSDSNKRIGGKQAVATVPSSSYQEILVRPSARVACITLANPPLNIIDLPMMDELVAAMEEVEQRPDTCAIVFSGSPRAFSAG